MVEYLRSFLYGRTGWDVMGGTLIISGAFAVFHRESVIDSGGFGQDTVTEDMDLIVQLHRWALIKGRKIKMIFTSDPVCWTECPSSLANLGRQRRRWQMGLCQTLWKNSEILFNRGYGLVGMVSYPFQLYVEALGAVVEFLGADPATRRMLEDIRRFVADWLPAFDRDNRSYLTVAIGCTGGRHRSVYLVEALAGLFRDRARVQVRHRELS